MLQDVGSGEATGNFHSASGASFMKQEKNGCNEMVTACGLLHQLFGLL